MSHPTRGATAALAADLQGFEGQIITPEHDSYDKARSMFNGMIDRRPLMIAQCASTSDVVRAVSAGARAGAPVAVRGGGHNVAGNAMCDGGIAIDLSLMQRVEVDPQARVARAQGGATWGIYDAATQAHGLASTGGSVSSTGIAGLTLGGGIGWLQRKLGLACDNLLSVEAVLADGSVVEANQKTNPDLFWALRGGGGNFGVVTRFDYGVHLIGPIIYGGMLAHPLSRAVEVHRFVREFMAAAPREVAVVCGMITGPDGSRLIGVLCCHCGSVEAGEKALAPLVGFGQPVLNHVGPIPYLEMQRILDAAFPPGRRNYWKSSFLRTVDDDLIATMADAYARSPSPFSALVLEAMGGAVRDIADADTAVGFRAADYNFLIVASWVDSSADEANRSWARDTFARAAGHAIDVVYVNYLGSEEDEGANRIRSAYGADKHRLLAGVKHRYDPRNLFRLNQNILPVAA